MDTASHLLFGVTLAGLAHLDPAVAQNPVLAQAVLAGTVIGSNAPDFDTVVRLRGYAAYIRHHRGVTHSLPALLLWPALIAVPLGWGFGAAEHWEVLYRWTLAAVVFHVFLDMFNTYGVQSLRPFTKQWVHLDVLAIFEPFLFLLHAAGLALWRGFSLDPAVVFSWVYGVTFAFITIRTYQHRQLVRKVQNVLGLGGICHVVPTFSWFHWLFVLETGDRFFAGKVVRGKVCLEDILSKGEKNSVIQATVGTDGVRAFLSFAQRVHVTCRELSDGYEVRWSEVRFWYDRKLPFGVDVKLDRNLNVVSQSLGWRKKAWDPPFV